MDDNPRQMIVDGIHALVTSHQPTIAMEVVIEFLSYLSSHSVYESKDEHGEPVFLDTPEDMINFICFQMEDFIENNGIDLESSNKERIDAAVKAGSKNQFYDRPEATN